MVIQQSLATVGPYVDAKKIALIKSGDEVLPGITARSQPGHTPGHTAYLVESEGHEMFFWGDIVHSAEVQFEHPEVMVQYDISPDKAVVARVREFEFTADRGILVASGHISFPGLRHVRKIGPGYRWVPIGLHRCAQSVRTQIPGRIERIVKLCQQLSTICNE